MKRAFDLVSAAVGLLVLSPLLVALAAWVKTTSRGPVFYRGVRAGLLGRPFRILKFRSMVVDAEALGGPSTSDDDPRVTRVGAFMRRYKLDEVPQLLNVVKGEMSLVGPRPEVLSEVAEYTAEQRRVLDVRPGVTDWASIWNSDEGAVLSGAADPHQVYKERIQPTKLALQLLYRDHAGLATDIRILYCTMRKLLQRGFVPREIESYGQP